MNRRTAANPTHRPASLTGRTALRALGLAIFALGLTAAPALAAPVWSISLSNEPTELRRSDERMVYSPTIENVGPSSASGPVTVTTELPGGSETSLFKAEGANWSCVAHAAAGAVHASVTCTRSNPLPPGDTYPALALGVRLGADSEGPTGTAIATVSGGGAASSAGDDAQYTFTPGLSFGAIPGSFEAGAFARGSAPTGVAVDAATGNVYATLAGDPNVEVAPPNRPFLKAFCEPTGLGAPGCEPTFTEPTGLAVDQSSGDLLVIDSANNTLSRFDSEGHPDDFSALSGTNVIDGHPGEADATGQGEILSDKGFGAYEDQVAIAPAGALGGTAGDIYVTDAENGKVDVFASSGEYLTQLSAGFPCGVAVDPAGDVYVGDYQAGVHKFVPSNGSPPPATTYTETGEFTAVGHPCSVAAGAKPVLDGGSEGFIFVAEYFGKVAKLDASTGAEKYVVSAGENKAVSVDPATGQVPGAGHVYAAAASEVKELDASGPSAATLGLVSLVAQAGGQSTAAGAHPFRAFSRFGFNLKTTYAGGSAGVFPGYYPIESTKDVVVDAPQGFVGNALATPKLCANVESVLLGLCPAESAIGGIDIYASGVQQTHKFFEEDVLEKAPEKRPIYSLEPEFGQPAQFAFGINELTGIPYTFVPELRPEKGYAISFRTAPLVTNPPLQGTNVTLCSFGVNFLRTEPDSLTGRPTGPRFGSCKGPADVGAYPEPLVTNPTRCSAALTSGLRIDSWAHPQEVKTYEAPLATPTDCDLVPFEPESELQPGNHRADSPTGLSVEFTMPTDGLLSDTGVAQANLDNITVTFPKGMSINPAAAAGLGACTREQVKLESNAEAECPESSKVGSIEIDTPLIRKTLTGSVYVAKQNDNPFKAPLGLYMVFASARDGVRVKVAGKLTPDPVTGQLVSSFVENPQWPFSHLALHFNEGPRAPLVNPPKCGTYDIHSEFSPWSAVNPANPTPAEIVSQDSKFEVSEGPGGAPCPAGNLEPKLRSGLDNPTAGAKSPFVLALSREDGSGRFTGLNVTTPKGLTAYLKGVPYCPDATLAGISGAEETGRPQLERPSCPAASQVGTILSGAGAGPFPFQAPGRVYLAGPYKGAPVSLAVVAPAVAGPFDLGNVVIRNALYIDPASAQVTAKSDPIPTILHGILLDIRQIRLALDRPNFTAAPTNCEPMSVNAHVSGEASASAEVSNRFQVGGCAALGFKPKLALRLFGGTHRGSHPRLVATLTARPGDANIAGASVALPHSEFLDQAHIRTVCTRVQFAAHQCPAGAIYGEAEAVTPLLDSPVKGPVYLRSSDNPLPDLVAVLRGPDAQPIEIDLDGRIDSIHGGIRSSFDAVPDQPVSSFTLRMQGGKKGLLVNSRNICNSVNKANAVFTAQNGRAASLRPVLRNSCKKKHKRHRRRSAR